MTKLEDKRLFIRYMNLLGVLHQKPSFNALSEIISMQVKKVPFENISKIYYKNKESLTYIPTLEQYLDGIEYYNFGGTCYSCNYHLHNLLKYLGYTVKLCGADMKNPDVHIVNIVTLQDKEYLIDAGNAAPFLAPIPLDLDYDFQISRGRDFYVLRPKDKDGRSQMQLYRNGTITSGYLINPKPRSIEDFTSVIAASFNDDAVFMNAILLVKIYEDRTIRIHNNAYAEIKGTGVSKIEITDREMLANKINEVFGIPSESTKEVFNTMPVFIDVY